jgi:hypothetical protein
MSIKRRCLKKCEDVPGSLSVAQMGKFVQY